MAKATVSSKGQITLPKDIREKMGIETGTELSVLTQGKEIALVPVSENPLEEMREMREKVQFSRQDIDSMIQESREKWSKLG